MKFQVLLVVFFVWTGCAGKAIDGTELSVVELPAQIEKIEQPEPLERNGDEGSSKHRATRAVMEIEDRSIFDQLKAIARLTGDISRNDLVGAAMDGLILAQVLPLHWTIIWLMKMTYNVLSFIHPVFWWIFPSTKPPNISGPGFRKVSFF